MWGARASSIIICLFLTFPVLSQEQGQNRPIILATVEGLVPFSFKNSHGVLTGVDIDHVSSLLQEGGIAFEIKTYPWARVMQLVTAGEVDGAFSVYRSPEREKHLLFLGPVHYDNLGIAVRTENQFSFHSVKDLYGKRIGKGLGVYISDDFHSAVTRGDIVVEEINDTLMGNIRKVFFGRIDAAIGATQTMEFYSRFLGVDDSVVILPQYIEGSRPGYLTISNKSWVAKDIPLLNRLTEQIHRFMDPEKYSTTVEGYFHRFLVSSRLSPPGKDDSF